MPNTRRRRRPPSPSTRTRKPKPSACRALVWVDSTQIRKKAVTDFKRARTTFEKAERELETHEVNHLPAYTRWYRVSFGPLIEEGKELQDKIRDFQLRIERVTAFCEMKECAPREAAEWLERDPDSFEREGERMWKEIQEQERRNREAEAKAHEARVKRFVKKFHTFIKGQAAAIRRHSQAGADPYDLAEHYLEEFAHRHNVDPEVLADVYDDPSVVELLKAHGLGHVSLEDDEDEDQEGLEQLLRNLEDMINHFEGTNDFESALRSKRRQNNDTDAARIKRLRRELAFSLHPDQGGKGDPKKIDLWHQVQEATAREDVDTLEVLHAHMQALNGTFSTATPISRIRELTHMFRNSRAALRRKIRSLRENPAWQFLLKNERQKQQIARQESKNLRRQIEIWKHDLRMAESEYNRLKRQTHTAYARRERGGNEYDPLQELFSFFQ